MSKHLQVVRGSTDRQGSGVLALATSTLGIYEFDFSTLVFGAAGKRFRIDSLLVEMVSAAGVGNRRLRAGLYETTGNAWIHQVVAAVDHAASLTRYYVIGAGIPLSTSFVLDTAYIPWTPVWVSDADAGEGASVRLRLESSAGFSDTFRVGFSYTVEA